MTKNSFLAEATIKIEKYVFRVTFYLYFVMAFLEIHFDYFCFSYDSVNDFRLRCDLMELYNALWGRVTPNCVPAHGVKLLIFSGFIFI